MAASTATSDSADSTDRDVALTDEYFSRVLDNFIGAAIAKARPRAADTAFAARYEAALLARARANSDSVDAFQTVSIEKILLRWFVLGSIKWDPVGIVIDRFGTDTRGIVEARRAAFAKFRKLAPLLHAEQQPEGVLEHFQETVLGGESLRAGEVEFLRSLAFRSHYFDSERTVHLALQPVAPPIEVDGAELRPDLYFWSPAVERFAVVVECAGFQPHARPPEAARSGPVALPENFRALRLAGIDMFRDPIGAVLQVFRIVDAALQECEPAPQAAVASGSP